MSERIILLSLITALLFVPVFATPLYARDFEDIEMVFEDRYNFEYPKDFFRQGGARVKFNQNFHLKVGIVIKNRSSMSIPEIIYEVFALAPLDRYRDFFVFVNQHDVVRGVRNKDFFIRGYNGYGRAIPGGFDIGESSIRAGLIVLNVEHFEFAKTGTKGYAKNKTATAQKMTILHELGHAFANLGDEYSIKENERDLEKREALLTIGLSYEHMQYKIWNTEYPNIDYRSHKILKWQPLVDQGFMSRRRFPRVQLKDGSDTGRFLTPTDKCIMNRILHDKMEFCPVCQLQIIDRIAQLTGAIPPWYAESE